MSSIIIGESMIEIVTGDDEPVHRPGGAFLNTAVALSRLGRHVRFLTDFGTDYDGSIIRGHLDQNSIQIAARPEAERANGTILSWIARVGTGLSPFSYDNIAFDIPNPPSTPTEQLDLDLFAPRTALFGSIACHIPPGDSKVLEWIKLLRETSTIFFDPNVRPTITPNLNQARERVEECISYADVVKASEKDILTLYGSLADFDSIARQWIDLGVSIVVITHGFKGSVLYSKSGSIIHIPAQTGKVVDPFGGGDAYMAALIDCLGRIALDTAAHREALGRISDTSLEMLGLFATAGASITIERHGPITPTRDELMDRYQLYRSSPHVLG